MVWQIFLIYILDLVVAVEAMIQVQMEEMEDLQEE